MFRAFARLLIAIASMASPLSAQQPAAHPLDTVRVAVASRVAPSLVSGQRSVEIISRETIDRHAARGVMSVLALAVGADVQTRSPAQADFALRGSSLGQVLILVDGHRVNDLQTAHFDLDLAVPLDAVERIEVLRGPGATLYGSDAVGGVVNIVTRREPWARVQAHGGSFETAGVAIGGSTTAGTRTVVRIAADAERSSGHREGTDFELLQATAGAERTLGIGRLSVDAGVAARDFGAADFYAPAPSYERTRTQSASMRWTESSLAGWTMTASATGRRHTDDFILRRADPAFYRNRHSTIQRTLELGARRAIGQGAGMALGAEGFDSELASARLGNRREQRASAFGEATLGRTNGANASAGIRVDRSTSLGTFASPSISASLPVQRIVRLRASAGRGLRAPSWTERYYADPGNVASADVGPERFWGAEIGARALPAWGSVDLAAFTRRAENLIEWIRPAGAPASVPWTTANLESATYRGIELAVAVPNVLGVDWTLHATGLDFDVVAESGYIGKYALRPLTHTIAASASYEVIPGLRITLDGRDARRAGEARYLLANMRTALDVRGITLLVDVSNITTARYLDASARPVAGRSVIVGLRL